jgi:hypothetical protein
VSDQFNYSDAVSISIYKVKHQGRFTHWESEIYDASIKTVAKYTGPTYGSVLDEAVAYINEEYPDWIKENANEVL